MPAKHSGGLILLAVIVIMQQTSASAQLFISYQWDKQREIKALYSKLTSLGYSCWLDVMQMGGGDSLYDKIDRGVRGCQLLLSCTTPKYAMSANCRSETSLRVEQFLSIISPPPSISLWATTLLILSLYLFNQFCSFDYLILWTILYIF